MEHALQCLATAVQGCPQAQLDACQRADTLWDIVGNVEFVPFAANTRLAAALALDCLFSGNPVLQCSPSANICVVKRVCHFLLMPHDMVDLYVMLLGTLDGVLMSLDAKSVHSLLPLLTLVVRQNVIERMERNYLNATGIKPPASRTCLDHLRSSDI